MTKRVLFCWEVGENRGHVQPYLALLSGLADNGWDVGLALRNTSVVDAALRARWPVFQAPVCVNEFTGIAHEPANHTEIYLGFGFAHEGTLAGLVAGWRALFATWRPSLVLANYSPTALFAAHTAGIPAIRIGTGFECPPGGVRPPLLQPWVPGIEARLDKAESLALATSCAVLRELRLPACDSLSPILHELPTLLATVPEFDEFPDRKGPHEYLGSLAGAQRGGVDPEGDVDVFGYLRVVHSRTAETLGAIAASGKKAYIYLPDATEAQCASWTTTNIRVSRQPADLARLLPRVRAVICYSSHGVVLDALLAGKPLLLLPTHGEQQRTADRVAALRAGITIGARAGAGKVSAGLRQVLEDPAIQAAARKFADGHSTEAGPSATSRVVTACEAAVFPSTPHLKVV